MPKLDERISSLETKLKQLKVRQQRIDARARALSNRRARKDDTRRKILIGATVLARIDRNELDNDTLHVVMGWAFRAAIPVGQITAVRQRGGLVGGIGVHGWRGRWLVNGATTGLLVITIDPPVRAWATGFPVQLRELTLSLEDPDALSVALGR